jgi:hypothetical protein
MGIRLMLRDSRNGIRKISNKRANQLRKRGEHVWWSTQHNSDVWVMPRKKFNTDSLEHSIWRQMRNRCNNPKNPAFPDYGGRGIKVCEPWLNSFENFYNDMGYRPPDKHCIDRTDNNGNYEPGNCKWVTYSESARNTRVKKTSKSGVKGVTFNATKNKWEATGRPHGKKKIRLGQFINIADAIKARKNWEASNKNEQHT